MDHFVPPTPYRAIFPPLGLLTLAALTPPEFRVTICDEDAGESVDYMTDAQIVTITGYILRMERVFEITDRFRACGKLVVIGGPLANLLPDECRPHCDVLFEGEAEYTWPRFLSVGNTRAVRVSARPSRSPRGARSGAFCGSRHARSRPWHPAAPLPAGGPLDVVPANGQTPAPRGPCAPRGYATSSAPLP
jgi:radical SAM superfamily enzyme YgiQ (UPF0313 family)